MMAHGEQNKAQFSIFKPWKVHLINWILCKYRNEFDLQPQIMKCVFLRDNPLGG